MGLRVSLDGCNAPFPLYQTIVAASVRTERMLYIQLSVGRPALLSALAAARQDGQTDQGNASGNPLSDRQPQRDLGVHADELQHKPKTGGQHEVPAKDSRVSNPAAPPANQQPRQHGQPRGLVQLSGMHPLEHWRESFGKRDGPRQVGGSAIVIPDKKAADAANEMPDGQCRRGSRQGGQERQMFPQNERDAGAHAPNQAAKPAEAAAREHQIEKRLLVQRQMLDSPDQLRSREAPEDRERRQVRDSAREASSAKLACEDMPSHDHAHGDQDAEAGDLKLAETEQDWVHAVLSAGLGLP